MVPLLATTTHKVNEWHGIIYIFLQFYLYGYIVCHLYDTVSLLVVSVVEKLNCFDRCQDANRYLFTQGCIENIIINHSILSFKVMLDIAVIELTLLPFNASTCYKDINNDIN